MKLEASLYLTHSLPCRKRTAGEPRCCKQNTAHGDGSLCCRAEMQEELEEATQRVKDLEGCKQEAAAIPGLRQDLRAATARVDHLQQQVKSLQVTAAGASCG